MAIKTNENFIPFSNNVTFRKPRGTDLVTASELIPGFCRSKSNVPTPGSLHTIKSPTAGIVPGIKSPSLAHTPPPPHGIYIDRCINISTPLTFCAFSKLTPQIYCRPHSCGMNIQRCSILYRGPKIWISLPISLTNSSSTFVFFKKSWNYLIDGHSVAY